MILLYPLVAFDPLVKMKFVTAFEFNVLNKSNIP